MNINIFAPPGVVPGQQCEAVSSEADSLPDTQCWCWGLAEDTLNTQHCDNTVTNFFHSYKKYFSLLISGVSEVMSAGEAVALMQG